tara:strand:+ start:267 stop:542 length:276 start_codon:yes stop_codon:yes gene_type:complete
MENKIIWIVDNPYGDKFTATRADVNVTSDITREEAKAMLGADGVWMSAKADAQCRAVPQKEVTTIFDHYRNYSVDDVHDWISGKTGGGRDD